MDISKCWTSEGRDANLVLRNGDELYVPEILNGVWVAGQVRNPGLVTWDKDMKWKDYIVSSGGFANNRKAQGIRIIRVNSGNWIKPTDKITINPGDIIFVPDKEERYTWDYVKDALLVASQLLTIFVVIKSF
jgi:protein involved in polysaccharide export with SLBB domain